MDSRTEGGLRERLAIDAGCYREQGNVFSREVVQAHRLAAPLYCRETSDQRSIRTVSPSFNLLEAFSFRVDPESFQI